MTDEAVAVLGYGRFGAALGALLIDAGLRVHAFDARTDAVPPALRAPTVEALLTAADVVVLAVPVASMDAAAALIRPFTRAEQLVMDVGSVKVKPEASLARHFGRDVPWVATHPLFGPTSLALAERPLRAVVCPNSTHPFAAARARLLYERIGCQVMEQDAHAHDRAMAETHALAFFIAKGMLDAAVGLDVPYAPPSFQAIARTVDVVRSDAGHLFTAIQRDNPYAAEARRRLLEALGAVDATLVRLEQPATPELASAAVAASLAIPESEAPSPLLLETRHLIDEVDRDLVALLGRRAELGRRACKAKKALGAAVHDPAREASLLDQRRAWASELRLDGDSVEDVFRAVLRFSRRLQGGEP